MILNQGEMVDQSNIDRHLETIKNIYQRLGFLENSTGTLFDKYVKQGQGAFPIVSAYENLIIEFYRAYPDYRTQIRERMRTLIPEPTVWSEHPFIALTQNGEALMTALLDPDIQKLAWDKYGFRSGVLGIENDPAILTEIGLPATIDVVTPLPAPEVMDRIIGRCNPAQTSPINGHEGRQNRPAQRSMKPDTNQQIVITWNHLPPVPRIENGNQR